MLTTHRKAEILQHTLENKGMIDVNRVETARIGLGKPKEMKAAGLLKGQTSQFFQSNTDLRKPERASK